MDTREHIETAFSVIYKPAEVKVFELAGGGKQFYAIRITNHAPEPRMLWVAVPQELIFEHMDTIRDMFNSAIIKDWAT